MTLLKNQLSLNPLPPWSLFAANTATHPSPRHQTKSEKVFPEVKSAKMYSRCSPKLLKEVLKITRCYAETLT